MRRTFSAFPDGWPGQGLLLLRVTVGLPLICWGIAGLAAAHVAAVPELTAAVAGVFLISGLFTPVAGAIVVLAEASMIFSRPHHGQQWIPVLFAALSASVAMLGPGAWSVDARRFGRKVFEIGGSPRGHR